MLFFGNSFEVAFPFIMVPLLRVLPKKQHDEVNGFFINAVKNMIALREQQDPHEVRPVLCRKISD